MIKILNGVAVAALCVAGSAASAATFSFSGNFFSDNDVQRFDFSVGSESDVTLRSYGYAGGTQADGNVVAAGGFDPILSLFGGDGSLIEQQDDAFSGVPSDPVTFDAYDVLLNVTLGAGAYFVTIQQYNNFAVGPNFADGFQQDGEGNFTSDFGCSAEIFCDVNDDNRTSAWAFDILGVDEAVIDGGPSVVPLPASGLLILAGLGALGAVGRRRTAA